MLSFIDGGADTAVVCVFWPGYTTATTSTGVAQAVGLAKWHSDGWQALNQCQTWLIPATTSEKMEGLLGFTSIKIPGLAFP